MATIYEECNKSVYDLAKRIVQNLFVDLYEEGVTFHVRFAANEDGDAVKHNGYPAVVLMKVNNYSDRQQGKKDCTLTIDKEKWDAMSDVQQEALIYHELLHLEIQRDKEGKVKLDDLSRPKMTCRKHDFVVGGFDAVVDKYGIDSPEFAQVWAIVQKWRESGLWKDAPAQVVHPADPRKTVGPRLLEEADA